MKLTKLTYSENTNQENFWSLRECEFGDINLLVGKNSTGKTRTINIIKNLAASFTGEIPHAFLSCLVDAVFDNDGSKIQYIIECHEGVVIKESLHVDGEVKLIRTEDGIGELFYVQLGFQVKFKIGADAIAVQQYQDYLQHPFLVDLSNWGRQVMSLQFGTHLGRDHFIPIDDFEKIVNKETRPMATVSEMYVSAFKKFDKPFDEAVISDMCLLGYEIVDVGISNVPLKLLDLKKTLFGMYVTEKDLGFQNFQNTMSQGMFRALALTIQINYCAFMQQESTILVDDIGEGLDYLRSKTATKLLIEKAEKFGFQLLMTSNDQFTMNYVPLEYWLILKRKGAIVTGFSEKNSREKFKKFKFMGLNNFDLFTSNLFD